MNFFAYQFGSFKQKRFLCFFNYWRSKMKKILVCAVLFAAVFLTVSCGGGSSDGGESYYQECIYGDYVCKYGDSYHCEYSGNDLIWQFSEQCDYCDSWTGRCDNNANNSSECSSGEYKSKHSLSLYKYSLWRDRI